MKIDKNKYPLIEKYRTKKFGVIGLMEDGNLQKKLLTHGVEHYRESAKTILRKDLKIRYIAKSIHSHINMAGPKIAHLFQEISSTSGIVIIDETSFLYEVVNDSRVFKIEVFCFNKDIFLMYYKVAEEISTHSIEESSYNFNDSSAEVTQILAKCWLPVLFMQYADIEKKTLLPKKQIKDFNCVYQNGTDLPIEIIDSTWFTTLVKSDAFKVRGHFRLQPYGEGMKQRKLIWINDFVKDGYTREAKILKENPAHP